MEKLKFSRGKNNAKLAKLEKLTGKIVYSLSLLSGSNCPGASLCKAHVAIKNGRKKLIHGKSQLFTCFSAAQEAAFPAVYRQRKHNTDLIKSCKSKQEIVDLIESSLPSDAEIIRWHVAGDWLNQRYFDAALEIAKLHPDISFYSYTKSIPFWIARIDKIPDNFILTASVGGLYDNLIEQHKLRKAVVVFSEDEAKQQGLDIDFTDFAAYNPLTKQVNIGLLLHGVQQKGTKSAQALKLLRKNAKKL